MADIKISELNVAGALTGGELVPIVKNAETVRTSILAISSLLNVVTTIKVSLSSAEILALNSTPKVLVAAQGASTMIMPIALVIHSNFVSVAYTTNTDLTFAPNTVYEDVFSAALAFAASRIDFYAIETGGAVDASAGINTPINLFCPGGNPAAGNGTMDVYLTYTVIPL